MYILFEFTLMLCLAVIKLYSLLANKKE